MSSTLLLDERVVAVQPAAVRVFGLAGAVVLQQIHWHSTTRAVRVFGEHEWVVMPYALFSAETGLNENQIRHAVSKLEEQQVLVSCQPEAYQRRKWYRIDRAHEAFRGDCTNRDISRLEARNMPLGSAKYAASSIPDTKRTPRARDGRSDDPSDRTARAAQQTRDRHEADLARIDAEPPSTTTRAHLAEARARVSGLRADRPACENMQEGGDAI